jgi:hypothetical protein
MNCRFVMSLAGNMLVHAFEAQMQCHCVVKLFLSVVLFRGAVLLQVRLQNVVVKIIQLL